MMLVRDFQQSVVIWFQFIGFIVNARKDLLIFMSGDSAVVSEMCIHKRFTGRPDSPPLIPTAFSRSGR